MKRKFICYSEFENSTKKAKMTPRKNVKMVSSDNVLETETGRIIVRPSRLLQMMLMLI